jgi:hypothetical protein
MRVVTPLPRAAGLAVYGKFYAAGEDALAGVLALELRVTEPDSGSLSERAGAGSGEQDEPSGFHRLKQAD